MWAFYWHFVKPVWPWFAVLMAVGLVGSLIELALYAFVGRIVDMMKDAKSPETFLSDNAWMLLFWGVRRADPAAGQSRRRMIC